MPSVRSPRHRGPGALRAAVAGAAACTVLLATACGGGSASGPGEAAAPTPATPPMLTCDDQGRPDMPAGAPPQPSTAAAPPPPATHEDVAYAETSPAQKLDLYLPPDASGETPLVIAVHGGGFIAGDKDQSAAMLAGPLLDEGYAVATVNYRLSCEAEFPAGAQDVKAAVRWLRANADAYRLDPDRFLSWGESAGGYMSALLAITGDQETVFDDEGLGNAGVSSAVQGAVAWYGMYDFAAADPQFAADTPEQCEGGPLEHDLADSPEGIWLGGRPSTLPDEVEQADPMTYIPTADGIPPVSIAAGDADCVVPHQQSEELHKALTDAGHPADLTVVEGGGHGPGVIEDQMPAALEFTAEVFER
ncbi:alpha/beta hydrolase [Nocardiopsis potens]|uniref:alpha/beta hydrolase n=1 Tax=Nocardiopsis potens TaxID=1246458 RepID=UPI001268EA32|nr:alpha/beta hydrolase [Nocardiopsis potens]